MLKTMMFICVMVVSAFAADYTVYQPEYGSKKYRIKKYWPVNVDEWLNDTSDSEKRVNAYVWYSFKETEPGQQKQVMHMLISDYDDKRDGGIAIEEGNAQRNRAEEIFECYISGIDASSAYKLAVNMLLDKPTCGVMTDPSLSNFRFTRVKGRNRVAITEYVKTASGEMIFDKEQSFISIPKLIVFDIKKCAEVICGCHLKRNKRHYRVLLNHLESEINEKYGWDWDVVKRENETKQLVREYQLGREYWVSLRQSLFDPLDPYFDLRKSIIDAWKGEDHIELID